MIVIGLYLIWGFGSMLVTGINMTEIRYSLMSVTKQEFCDGNLHVVIDPKYIPDLLDYLKFCTTLSKEPSVNSFAKRQAIIHLFNSATPVIHKAFFDSKTTLRHVASFTKLKHEAVQFASYANRYGDHNVDSRKKLNDNRGKLSYAPGNDGGSYNLNDDLRVCASILNRQQNTSVKNIIKLSQLPRVAKSARIITFPPFNLSVAVSSDDTPYMILDMYVLAMRCLSFTNLHPNTTARVSELLISHLKKKVMPYVPPHEFEKAYSEMTILNGPRPVARTSYRLLKNSSTTATSRSTSAPKTSGMPIMLEIQYNSGGHEKGPETRKLAGAISLSNLKVSPKKSFRELFMALLRRRQNDVNSTLLTHNVCCERASNPKALMIIASILAACGTLAVILYCLLFGCCGWLTISKYDNEEHDEVDQCLETYARVNPEKLQNKCYCTLADSNQVDVIAALHQRCELLSQKICEVVREISQENVFVESGSMDVLRDFIRSVSTNMVDENDTINQFGKSLSSLVKLQNKPNGEKRYLL